MSDTAEALAAGFARDGYLFPLTAMTAEDARRDREMLERVEASTRDDPVRAGAFRRYANIVLPFVDAITRRPEVIDPVAAILGPDLLVFDCSFFIKEARSPSFVSWHQDLHYWGLEGEDEVTAWVALSPATIEAGCMRFVQGSHKEVHAHTDTFDQDNLLTRGQEVSVDVDERRAVDVVLAPGQMSLHHGRTVHGSRPNGSADRRIGLAIRYISTRMRQIDGARMTATLVAGEDRHGHFELAGPPSGVMTDADLARHAEIADQRKAVMMRATD